jgi:hypothetical protein
MIEEVDLGLPKISAPAMARIELVEMLAAELHRQYRAAEKAMNRAKTIWRGGVQIPNPNRLLHDHGWSSCGKRDYFRKRAALIMRRASCTNPETLGEAETALQAAVLQRRLIVEGKAAPNV